jgi:hypothetical protein
MEVPKTAVRLSLAYRDLETIPAEIVDRFAASTVELDLSNNAISYVNPLRPVASHCVRCWSENFCCAQGARAMPECLFGYC